MLAKIINLSLIKIKVLRSLSSVSRNDGAVPVQRLPKGWFSTYVHR